MGKKNRGRPRIDIDLDLVGHLARQGCSIDEIAGMLRRSGLKIDLRTLKTRLKEASYREAWETGQLAGKAWVRSRLVQLAKQNKNLSVAARSTEFLAERWLGMNARTAIEVTNYDDGASTAHDRINKKLNELRERIVASGAAITANSSLAEVNSIMSVIHDSAAEQAGGNTKPETKEAAG